jgi:hypothetical protein
VPAKPAPPPALVRAAEAAVPAAPAPAPTPPVPAPLGAAADLLASAADATPTASPVAVEVESTPVSVSRGPSLAEQEVVAAIADDGSVRASLVRVSLNAQPWAHIEVDGRDLGVTPMADVELEAGPHRFRARFADGRVMERTLRVDALRDHITFP